MTGRTVRLPDGPVVKDPQTGYHWLLLAEHPAGGAWVALRWHGPVLEWSGSHPVVLSEAVVERMRQEVP